MCKLDLVPDSDDALIAHIERAHHTFLRDELPALHGLLRRVVDSHAEAHQELQEVLETYEEMACELLGHIMKEQMVLFPMVQSLCPGIPNPVWRRREVQNVLRVMRDEHARTRAALARIRALTGGYASPEPCHHYGAALARLEYFERAVLEQIDEEETSLMSRAATAR